MKKFIFISFIWLALSGVAFAVTIPSEYKKIYSETGFKTYKKGNIYVNIVDLEKVDVIFGNVNKASSGNSFLTSKLNSWWSNLSGTKIAIFNGQFFRPKSNPTPLSFPLKSKWNTIATHVDPGNLRTLRILGSSRAIISSNYYSYYLNNTKELIVGLNPSQNMKSNKKIGRSYIGALNDYNSSSLRYLLFFISKKSTQADMNSEISEWGVLDYNVVMMDGSGSAQMKTSTFSVYGSNGFYTDKRELPNVISINRIWR